MFTSYVLLIVAFLATVVFLAGFLSPGVLAMTALVLLWGAALAPLVVARRRKRRAPTPRPGSPDALTGHLQAVLDSLVDGVVVTDADGAFRIFNPAAERILGIGKTDTGPEEWPEAYGLYLPDGETPFPHHNLPLVRALKGEHARQVEILVRHDQAPQGLWLSVSASPFTDGAGTILGAAAVFRDVTEQKRAHAEAKEARDAADAASRAKSVFLANMSHEMRTPMNAVLGLTDLVLDTRLTPEQREYLSLVRASGQTLLALIDDALDLSRIEAGRLSLNPVTFDLRDAVCDTVRSLAFQARGKGLDLVCSLDPRLPSAVSGDPVRLGQILYNLIGNAIKFTPRGEVVVRMELGEAKNDRVVLLTSVSDTGIGIPPESLDTVFDLFEQVDPSPSRNFGGAGLGLTISARLAELLEGRIWAESAVGKGSTFHFTARVTVASWKPADPDPDLSGLRALVVDRSPAHRKALTELLVSQGMTCEAPESPPPPVSLAPGPGGKLPYDVYLISGTYREDGGMGMARKLVGQRGNGREAVILMLAAGTRREEGGDTAGADTTLLTPVNPTELVEAIAIATGRRPQPVRRERARKRTHRRSLHVLLAEDSPVNQRLARDLLEHWGHTVTVAGDGKEAVDAAGSDSFDLVLMDVQMPGTDGLEAARIIRSRSGSASPPIYALTAHASRDDRERYRKAGIDGIVEKPLRVEKLFSLIEAIVDSGVASPSDSPAPISTPGSAP